MHDKTAKIKISPEMYEKDVMYGMATMGPRGQIVIPAEARKDLCIEPGDRLVVMGKLGKVLSLTKAEDVEGLISLMMDNLVEGSEDESFRQHVEKQLAEMRKVMSSENN